MKPLLIAAVCCIAFAACKETGKSRSGGVEGLDERFAVDTLEVVNDDGLRYLFDVYLATGFEQQRQGLMYVLHMPETTGMLFVYQTSDLHSMWMKNTFIPLDMVFARGDGTVSSVIHDTKPHSLASQSAIEPVQYVLELNAGTAKRLNIGNDSRLIWNRKTFDGE